MKHKREAENRSRRPAAGWLILLTGVIIAAVVCTAILVRKAPEQGDQPSAGPSAAETEDPREPDESLSADGDIQVETPFCTLYFPGKWRDQISTRGVDLGYGYEVFFFVPCGDDTTELFAVLFGFRSTYSTRVGAIVSNGIATSVNLEMPTPSDHFSWTEEQQKNAFAMQEDVQYLLDRLAEEPLFTTESEGVDDAVIPEMPDVTQERP